MKRKASEAKVTYAPQIDQLKQKYEDARVKYKGYKAEKINDVSETGFLTDFEFTLPLNKIDIDEYERRLKLLVQPGSNETINEAQLIEAFSDQVYLKEVSKEGSLIRKILLHPTFLDPKVKGNYSIP